MPVGFNKMGNVEVITFKLGWYFRTQTYLLGGGLKNMQKADKMQGHFYFLKGTDQTQEKGTKKILTLVVRAKNYRSTGKGVPVWYHREKM